MIYPYRCDHCQNVEDVVKPMKDASNEEACSKCGSTLSRIYTPTQILYAKVQEAYFCNGTGRVIQNKRDLNNELKKREAEGKALIPMGNESTESMAKNCAQTLEKKLKSYDD